MKINLSIEKIGYLFIIVILFAIITLLGFSESINCFIAWLLIFFSVLLAYKWRKNILSFIVALFIAYSNYSIAMGVYIYDIYIEELYKQISDIRIYGIGITMLLFFVIFLIIISAGKELISKGINEYFVKKENGNDIIFFLLLVSTIFIIIFSYDFSLANIIGRGESSALYEYSIILMILMFYYSGGKKRNYRIIYALIIIYTGQSFFSGNRIEAICALIACFLCIHKEHWGWKKLLPIAILGIIAMNFIGSFRNSQSSQLSLIVKDTLINFWNSKCVFDTCTCAYFPTIAMIEIFEVSPLSTRIYFLKQFIYTTFMGSNRVIDGNLINYIKNYYWHLAGGTSIGFYWVWFGWFGSFVYALNIKIYLNLIEHSSKENDLKSLLCIYFASTVPRWYLYGPWPLFRGMLACSMIFLFFKILKKLVNKNQI